MIEHPVKRLWAEGKAAVNGWLSIGNGFTAEIMASAGYDSVTADLQHGAFDYHAILGMFQAMRASGGAPMARVPWLDAGAGSGTLRPRQPADHQGERGDHYFSAFPY